MHKNARAFKAHAFIAHGVGYVKKKARAFISHAMHIKARDMKKTARGGRIALFLEKARAVIVHRCCHRAYANKNKDTGPRSLKIFW